MITFLIQAKYSKNSLIPAQKFGYDVIEAIEYDEWWNKEKRYDYILVENVENIYVKSFIPVGSVEFVSDFIKHYFHKDVKPLNIPDELINFANRKIAKIHYDDIEIIRNKVFAKSDTRIKGFSGIISKVNELPPNNTYLISELIDIKSEWRCFVRNNRLLDMKCYSGDFGILPNIDIVNKMIWEYGNSCPPAYTLDVCIDSKNNTSIIEVHNFFSCGLYGFEDYRNYLQMLIQAFRWQINQ